MSLHAISVRLLNVKVILDLAFGPEDSGKNGQQRLYFFTRL